MRQYLPKDTDLSVLAIQDGQAVEAMRVLAKGSHQDVPIVASKSGMAGLAALETLRRDWVLPTQVGLNARSRVLVINAEGATAPVIYQGLIGESAALTFLLANRWQDANVPVLTSNCAPHR